MNAAGTQDFYWDIITTSLSNVAIFVSKIVLNLVLKIVLEKAIKEYFNWTKFTVMFKKQRSIIGAGDQIESQSSAGTFPSSSQQVEESDLLLRNSTHMTSTTSSSGMKAQLRAVKQAGMHVSATSK